MVKEDRNSTHSLYLRHCKEFECHPQECVLEQLGRAEDGCLNLSGNSLTIETCMVLGRVLSVDTNLQKLNFSDCVLTDEGAKQVINGLVQNRGITELNLKGNNLRAGSCEALGRMLRHNHSLQTLLLEWNGLGMWDSSFSVFMQGLAANSTLKHLDLRSNQITHDGAAEIGAALKANHTIESIDLRWNNIGILGGRSLLSILPHNRTLLTLETCGNNIPDDLSKALESTIKRNGDNRGLSQDYEIKTQVLTREIRHLQNEKQAQLSEMMEKMESEQEKRKKEKVDVNHKLGQLQEALSERKAAYNQVVSKLKLTESELALAEQRTAELDSLVKRAQADGALRHEKMQEEMKAEREDRFNAENKMLKEISALKETVHSQQMKIDELQRKLETSQNSFMEIRDVNTRLETELKLKMAETDELVQSEKHRSREALRDAEDRRDRDLLKQKQEHDENTKQLRDRISKLEKSRSELEEEVSRIKSQALQEKMAAEDEITSAKHRIRNEEEQRAKHLEDKLRLVQQSKEELTSYVNQQTSLANQLQGNVNTLTLENEALKRRVDELTQEVANKSSEVSAAVLRTKTEMGNQVIRLEAENASFQEVCAQKAKLEKKLQDKSYEIEELRSEISRLQQECHRMREDENNRMLVLQNAIQNYVSSAPRYVGGSRSGQDLNRSAPIPSRDQREDAF